MCCWLLTKRKTLSRITMIESVGLKPDLQRGINDLLMKTSHTYNNKKIRKESDELQKRPCCIGNTAVTLNPKNRWKGERSKEVMISDSRSNERTFSSFLWSRLEFPVGLVALTQGQFWATMRGKLRNVLNDQPLIFNEVIRSKQ